MTAPLGTRNVRDLNITQQGIVPSPHTQRRPKHPMRRSYSNNQPPFLTVHRHPKPPSSTKFQYNTPAFHAILLNKNNAPSPQSPKINPNHQCVGHSATTKCRFITIHQQSKPIPCFRFRHVTPTFRTTLLNKNTAPTPYHAEEQPQSSMRGQYSSNQMSFLTRHEKPRQTTSMRIQYNTPSFMEHAPQRETWRATTAHQCHISHHKTYPVPQFTQTR